MAKAAVIESSASENFPFGRVPSDARMKRKLPQSFGGEQLKRRSGEIHVDAKLAPLLVSDRINVGASNDPKKPELKIPKYISTCINEVYPIKKSSERCRLLYGKGKSEGSSTISKMSNDFSNSFVALNFPPRGEPSLSCEQTDNVNIFERSDSSAKENCEQGFRKIEKCNQSALRNVVELHLGNEKSSDSAEVDMQKALKGLVARNIPTNSCSWADSSGKHGDRSSVSSRSFCSEVHIPGHKTPLEFTLKTTLRLVSSSSVKWCHKLSATPAATGLFCSQFYCNKEQNFDCKSGPNAIADAMFRKALHSWVHPQSSLPASIISAMSLSTVKGEKDFLSRRMLDWEDSFQNLYYMLRKNMCNIFYEFTPHNLWSCSLGETFWGRNTHVMLTFPNPPVVLRSLLKKQEIHFSMPLCSVESEQAAEDDLVELSEIEKRNLGQTVQSDSMSDVDNSPQSLLAFIGNQSAHCIYDFLLNYRFFLNSLVGVDVPVLYAPVPFQNGSLSVPEVRCREMKRADSVRPSSSESDAEGAESSLGSICL